MQKRIVLVIFFILAAVLAFAVIEKKYFSEPQKEIASAKLVIPRTEQESAEKSKNSEVIADSTVLASLVPLRGDETLIDSVSMDFNGDGYEDQVNAVRTASSPCLQLLVGLYNPRRQTYERSALISTRITQAKTFVYTGMDLIGDHSQALVLQGLLQNGNSILQAYLISNKNDTITLDCIADLEGDGTVFVQQIERNESYERSLARGTGFPIWVYSSDSAKPNSTDQLQTCYEWNPQEKKYTKTKQTRVTGSKIAAKELASIQDGTVETFANFLDGLWYKTETKTGAMRYLFFDYPARQIIFLLDDDEEVYNWHNSSLHYRGMSVSTTNLEIVNLHRNVNISLLAVDEISILIKDDVRMPISEENTWNGAYKKMKFSDLYAKKADEPEALSYIKNLEKGIWKSSDGTHIEFSEGTYTVTGETVHDTGDYTSLAVADKSFIQFRSLTGTAFFKGSYLPLYSPSLTDEKTPDTDRIILQPYVIRADRTYASEERPVILTRERQQPE